ncbi:MAG: SDR family oxidoreductase [Chloroflexi bacterium]|nr:SDR family oxidoreductase [Chloroflexota bacterium]
MRLQDRISIVTGAGRGIGRAIALGFAREGAGVVIADLDPDAATSVAGEVRSLGRPALAVEVDVTQRAQVEAMVERAVAELGRVDVLVSNAGISLRQHFLELTEEVWDRVLGVNLKGVFLCGQAAARQMAKTGGGAIINIASQRAEAPDLNQAPYAASKGGVRTLTKAMALDLAPHGIRVNAIGPGPVLTDLNRHRLAEPGEQERFLRRLPLGRIGDPDDIAGPAIFLASDEARWVTGHTLFVDGGWLAS